MSFGQISKDALISCKLHSRRRAHPHFLFRMIVLDQKWPEAKRGVELPLHETSIIIQTAFHYLCLNFMLFKLFIRRRAALSFVAKALIILEGYRHLCG